MSVEDELKARIKDLEEQVETLNDLIEAQRRARHA